MLEIILVVYASQRLSKVAKEKGRPGAWGALFAAGWIAGEFFGAFLGALLTDGDMLGAYGIALLGAVAGGTAAWFIVKGLSPLGSAGAAPYPQGLDPSGVASPAQALSAPVRRAGFCMECGTNVWLTGTGSCPNGHGPQSLTNCYTVEG